MLSCTSTLQSFTWPACQVSEESLPAEDIGDLALCCFRLDSFVTLGWQVWVMCLKSPR